MTDWYSSFPLRAYRIAKCSILRSLCATNLTTQPNLTKHMLNCLRILKRLWSLVRPAAEVWLTVRSFLVPVSNFSSIIINVSHFDLNTFIISRLFLISATVKGRRKSTYCNSQCRWMSLFISHENYTCSGSYTMWTFSTFYRLSFLVRHLFFCSRCACLLHNFILSFLPLSWYNIHTTLYLKSSEYTSIYLEILNQVYHSNLIF